jgi:hypothetical protein
VGEILELSKTTDKDDKKIEELSGGVSKSVSINLCR